MPARTSQTLHPPIPSHCASIVATSTLRVKETFGPVTWQQNMQFSKMQQTGDEVALDFIEDILDSSATVLNCPVSSADVFDFKVAIVSCKMERCSRNSTL